MRSSATSASSAARLQSGILPSYSWRPDCTAKYGSVLNRASMNESTNAGHSVADRSTGGGAAAGAGFSASSREHPTSNDMMSRLEAARNTVGRILDLQEKFC